MEVWTNWIFISIDETNIHELSCVCVPSPLHLQILNFEILNTNIYIKIYTTMLQFKFIKWINIPIFIMDNFVSEKVNDELVTYKRSSDVVRDRQHHVRRITTVINFIWHQN